MARQSRSDLMTALLAAVLVAAAVVAGRELRRQGVPIHALAAPVIGIFQPHAGPGTPLALALAIGVVVYGPGLAHRLRWRTLLPLAWVASFGWILALGLVDGWARMSARLTHAGEYLIEVPDAPPLPELLHTFTDRIVAGPADAWTTHVAGHPPGALMFFLLLDRIGLRGGGWAAFVVVLLGASACVAIAVTLRAIDSEQLARRALPFLVAAPAAVWMGVSADGMFLAVSAWGIALLAVAFRVSSVARSVLTAAGGGLLLGATLYLSYGLLLIGLVAVAVLLCGLRRTSLGVAGRVTLTGGAAVLAVVVAMTAAGFAWWEGYDRLVVRYYQGWGAERPYSYWVWANLAALAMCVGPAAAAGLGRAFAAGLGSIRAFRVEFGGTVAVVLAAALAVVAADLSGLSKAEVERIWLPFALWLIAGCALLPRRFQRGWLAAQVGVALLVQHLVLTSW